MSMAESAFDETSQEFPKAAGHLIFEFFADEQVDGLSSWDSSAVDFDGDGSVKDAAEGEDEEEENGSKAEAAKAFWNSQEELLLANLRRTTSLESKIRKATKEALAEMGSVGFNCGCRQNEAAADCRECTQKQVCDWLQKAGFNCIICKSKWTSSPEIPAGEHSYLEVEQNLTAAAENDDDRRLVKVIIELNFKSEFQMAKACTEYDQMVGRLPDVYVGKPERLKALIKILCGASKRCMKDNKMHRAPWRKHKYMQAKWLGKPANRKESPLILPAPVPAPRLERRPGRPMASMLTFDLMDSLPSLHQANNTMIRVV